MDTPSSSHHPTQLHTHHISFVHTKSNPAQRGSPFWPPLRPLFSSSPDPEAVQHGQLSRSTSSSPNERVAQLLQMTDSELYFAILVDTLRSCFGRDDCCHHTLFHHGHALPVDARSLSDSQNQLWYKGSNIGLALAITAALLRVYRRLLRAVASGEQNAQEQLEALTACCMKISTDNTIANEVDQGQSEDQCPRFCIGNIIKRLIVSVDELPRVCGLFFELYEQHPSTGRVAMTFVGGRDELTVAERYNPLSSIENSWMLVGLQVCYCLSGCFLIDCGIVFFVLLTLIFYAWPQMMSAALAEELDLAEDEPSLVPDTTDLKHRVDRMIHQMRLDLFVRPCPAFMATDELAVRVQLRAAKHVEKAMLSINTHPDNTSPQYISGLLRAHNSGCPDPFQPMLIDCSTDIYSHFDSETRIILFELAVKCGLHSLYWNSFHTAGSGTKAWDLFRERRLRVSLTAQQRQRYHDHNLRYMTTFSGGMFEQLMPSIFLGENPYMRQLGIFHMLLQRENSVEIGYETRASHGGHRTGAQTFGWSPCATHRGYETFGVTESSNPGRHPRRDYITPHALLLGAEFDRELSHPVVAPAVRALLRSCPNVYHEQYGFFDSVRVRDGAVVERWLFLDQAMIALSLLNTCFDGIVRETFMASETVAAGRGQEMLDAMPSRLGVEGATPGQVEHVDPEDAIRDFVAVI